MNLFKQLKQFLLRRADNPQQNLKILIAGFLTFVLGGALVVSSEFLLMRSFFQESLALLGLILMGGGLILAALGYISLSVLRLFRFFNNEPSDDRTTPS